jgi:phage head maturation protease
MDNKFNTIKEELNSNIVRISCESFDVVKTENGMKVVGLALPFNKISRNGFTYITESIKSAHKTMEKKPVLFNHDASIVIGHNISNPIQTEGMGYEVDINPNAVNQATGVSFAESIARGDISKVSIQCLYDQDKSFLDEQGNTHAFIKEFLEMSFVTIPGFEDTTSFVVESYKTNKEKNKMDNVKKEEGPAAPIQTEPNPDKDSDRKDDEAQDSKMKEEMVAMVNECKEMISALNKRVEAVETAIKPKESVDEKKPADDEDEKREEAINKNKVIVSTEGCKEEVKTIKTSDLKRSLMSANEKKR